MKQLFSPSGVLLSLVIWAVCFSTATAAAVSPAGGANAAASPLPIEQTKPHVLLPGPLRSFLRMAAISQKASPEEILPFLARNVVVEGYQYWQEKSRKPTEFLILLKDYIQQAKELTVLAGPESVIRISTCA